MSSPGKPVIALPRDDAVRNDFLASRTGNGNYDWILNAASAPPGRGAASPAGEQTPGSQQPAGQPGGSSQASAGAKPASPAGPAAGGDFPRLVDPNAPIGMQLEQSFRNVWESMRAEAHGTLGQLRADAFPKNADELKAALARSGGDPIGMLTNLGLDTSAYLFSPVTGAAKQIVGGPVRALTGSKTAGAMAGNAAAIAAGLPFGGGEAKAAQEASSASVARETESGSETAAAGAEATGAKPQSPPPRVFDLAGEEPGKAFTVSPEMRDQAAAYITGRKAESPFEIHLDQAAADPVAAVADLAKTIPKDGVKPIDVTRMGAYSLNLSPDELLTAIRPSFPSDETMDAAAMLVKSAGAQFWKAAQKATAPEATAADMDEAIRAYAYGNKVIGAVRDAKTDWGRAGRIQQEMAASFSDFDRQIHDIISGTGEGPSREDLEAVVRRTAQLDDPAKAPSFLSSLRWMGTKQGFLYGWYNWLLSNPAVVAKKIGSDLVTAAIHTGDTFAAEKFGSGAVPPGETSALVSGYLGAFSDSLRAARKGLMAGSSQFVGADRTLDGLTRTRLSALANGADELPADAPPSPTLSAMQYLRAALPTSWMGAADDFGKTFHYRAAARALLYREGSAKGLVGDDLANHVVEGLNNIPQHVHEQAVATALRNTFTEPMAPAAQALQDWSDKLQVPVRGVKIPVPLGRLIAPFMRIGANATRFVYLHSPLPLAFPSGGFEASVQSGGASKDLAYARIGLGTGVSAILATLASGAGNVRITGRGPSDPELARHWRDAGNKPYHLYVGDTGFSMPLEPIATHMGAIADTADILRYAHDEDADQVAWSLVFGVGSAMLSRSYNQGIANFIEALHDPDNKGERYGNNLLGSMAMPPGADAIRNATDPWLRAHYGLLDAIAARTPGLSQSLPPQRNLWGEPLKVESGILPGALGRGFVPFKTDTANPEPVDKWIWENRNAFPDAEAGKLGLNAPGQVQSFHAPGERGVSAQVKLTPQQLDRLKVLAGNELKGPAGLGAKDAFNALVTGKYPDSGVQSRWDAATPEAKAVMMTSLWNKYRDQAKQQLVRENSDLQSAIGTGLATRRAALKPPTLGAGP